uniref:Uncharacterized protein isoform X3 n=1 Tax=Nicotiana tabacum TaxID=4097 RepID=A0A1S4CGF7_TOBAC|nr:PREDICTED: uncharacterized protein LOC107818538 isoform X3 [Nicotiana tabacum]
MGKNGFIREEAEERRKASISHSDTSAAARQLQPHQYTAVVGLSPACQILPLFSSQDGVQKQACLGSNGPSGYIAI